ncbi:conserved membrane protein of unknown function [Oenococcus oeni]|uniref:DUF218 domain-containing protein n=17 Tax=Oenococcus oeni TaxID=1247 RepID=A0AAQ2ZDT6_OENOE|nr:YdcF family protein [Oenococcus oeni]USO99688.1 YdcF family protein [Oenococcus oeni]SYW06276.1 conserved membrane hypothetical protein [Oenococcus oeni]VDB97168.1 conserved membrane protein of unknown function [Oenococcus oeni]
MLKNLETSFVLTNQAILFLFSISLIFLLLFVYYLIKDYRNLKTAFTLNLAGESFLLALLIISARLGGNFFVFFRFIIFLFVALIVALAFYSGITLVIWSFQMSADTKYRSRYRFSTRLVTIIFPLLCLMILFKLFKISLPPVIGYLFAFIPAFVIYLGFVFTNFITQTIIVNLKGKQLLKNRQSFDYSITLGAGLIQGKRVSKNLESRLQRTLDFAKRHHNPKLIMSGGQGYDEKISEAKAMRTWIIKHNYSPSKVILEDRSTNTKENFQKSAEKILEDQKTNNLGKQIRMVFVTNSYHLTRANYIAFSNNLKIFGIPAKTTRNYLALGWFREFAAMLLIKKHQHLFVLVLLLVISLGLALFSWIN